MLFSFAAAVFAASAAVVSAQGNGTTHNVIVGGSAGLVFTPSTITAAVGDIVTFEFQTKNHTVTQSSFATPCALLQNATSNQVGFDSGFVPVAPNATEFPAWSIQVTDAATPIWFYCKQATHCVSGMVGAINAPAAGPKTFDAFMALAKGGNATAPATPSGSTVSGGNAGVGASASAAVSGGDPAATGASSTDTNSSAGSLKIASTGLALSVVAAVTLLFA